MTGYYSFDKLGDQVDSLGIFKVVNQLHDMRVVYFVQDF